MTLYVADIASYQNGLVPAKLKPDCAALIVKCTQGSSYVDPDYAAWLDEARHCGLLVGAYHYMDGSSPAAQAANLRAHIVDPTLIVMLDQEQIGLPQTLEVADAMTALGLHVRFVYLSRTYWSAVGSPDLVKPFTSRGLRLVNAAYPSSATGSPAVLYPGDGADGWVSYGGVVPTLYQFTESATEAGQRIDVSAFRGTYAGLADLFAPTAPASPAPHPAAPAAPSTEDEMSTTSTNGRAGLSWPAGTRHVVQVTYDPAPGDPKLRVVWTLTTGPLVAALNPAHGTGTLDLAPEHVAACRGVVLELAGGSPNVVFDACAV